MFIVLNFGVNNDFRSVERFSQHGEKLLEEFSALIK